MRKALAFVASALILASTAVGCAATTDDSTSDDDITKAKPAMNVSESDNGKTIVVNEGANLVLSLSTNASTGYSWMVKSSGGLADPTSKYENVTNRPGASSTEVFTWK